MLDCNAERSSRRGPAFELVPPNEFSGEMSPQSGSSQGRPPQRTPVLLSRSVSTDGADQHLPRNNVLAHGRSPTERLLTLLFGHSTPIVFLAPAQTLTRTPTPSWRLRCTDDQGARMLFRLDRGTDLFIRSPMKWSSIFQHLSLLFLNQMAALSTVASPAVSPR